MKFVNIYEVSQHYGGPEEGGWWYTAGELVETAGPMPEEQARELATAVRSRDKSKLQYMMGFNDTDGCDPDGNGDDSFLMRGGAWGYCDVTAYVQDKPGPEYFPERRPHYE